jgi:tRNA-splicing ligase RtcB (3'-phosphate/5'-hydroxy nucleic acid ligase)
MPFQLLEGARQPIKVFLDDLSELEDEARQQLINTANLPWVEGVAAMPDVHYGKGATIGSVLINREAVSPSVVGVDIGCGMMACQTRYTASDLVNLPQLRHSIERSVPVGFNQNKEVTARVGTFMQALGQWSEAANPHIEKAALQLGTLGGGNHFIEICLDEHENVWVMLHSGSRNIGKTLADVHINKAKGLMADTIKRYGEEFDPDLACLMMGTPEYTAYIFDLLYAQKFARFNREEMMLRVLKDLSYHLHKQDIGPEMMVVKKIQCHHNYIEYQEDARGPLLVTRKGAVSAKQGELGIIPGSMGAQSFIVRGRGNADSYCSCAHGAGRRMSRGAAKRQFTTADLEAQTAGVECRKDKEVLDEIPGAYKDIKLVMENQSDLVEIVATLKQILCVKG